MTFAIREDKLDRRTDREKRSAETRERLWAQRLTDAATPKEKAQVWYDRIRGVVSKNLPATLSLELWGMVVDDLSALCDRLQARVDAYHADQRTRTKTLPPKVERRTFW